MFLALGFTLPGAIAQTTPGGSVPANQSPVSGAKQGAVAQTKQIPVAKTAAQSKQATQGKQHRKSRQIAAKVVPPPVLPPMPRGPLPQLPMDLMPAAAPKVTYQNGLLTIVAQNSTLADILREVHKLTGASTDVPPNATERVVARLGPGEPRDVLASLLNGTAFNYVMAGSASNPTGVASLVLTQKTVAGAATATPANPYQPAQSIYTPQAAVPVPLPVPQPVVIPGVTQPAVAEGDDSASAEEQEAADENTDQVQTETQQPDANGVVQQEPGQAQPQLQPQVQTQQPNAGPKTPEQILEMLRQQQSITPAPQNPPPPPEE
jgi:hypothetical protein